mmetsp:Transcript_1028/g.2641  ORF Transcript_1028/g.2641 Transcript_1028/m.2641 type:complete len:619 (-) Transcript_1028:177-2033(-)
MATTCGCGGCFEGFRAKQKVAPDVPAGVLGKAQVSTLQEAMALQRPNSGVFLPSPTAAWASPVPRDGGATGAVSLDGDFEIVMHELETLDAARDTMAIQLDTDGARHMTGGGSMQHSRFEVEQMFASPATLPKPMSMDERESQIRTSVPTATNQILAQVPRKLLLQATDEGQNLRRNVARGATVVFVGAGLPGKRFTFERAAAMGIKVAIIEHPDSWSQSLVGEGVVAKFLPVDMSQSSEAVFEAALAHIRSLGQDGLTGPVDGVVTFVELSVPLVARLCETLGLPGHTPAAVDAARNKHETRAALKRAGLPTPKNYLIASADEVEKAGKIVGFPAVLKPVSGAASLGVKKVTSAEELAGTYKEIVDELSTLVVSSGALIQGSPDSGGVNAKGMVDLSVLMEQYLDGPEVDVDIVMSGGEYQYAGVADNGPTMEPYFNETWAVCPSLLPLDQQRSLKELAVACVKALEFTVGVFHVECKMTSNGPHLIEVNARMGGGQVHETNLRCWGVDLVEEMFFACLGIPSRPPVPQQPRCAVAYCYVNAPTSGKVVSLEKLEAVSKRQNIVWAKPLVRPGVTVVGPEQGLPTWLCDLFVTGQSSKKALAYLEELQAEDLVPVEK